MAKRSLSSGPATPRKRRLEVGKNQSKLDSFFKSSQLLPSSNKLGAQGSLAETSPEPSTLQANSKQLTAPADMDLKNNPSRCSVLPANLSRAEVIDVDLLDDNELPLAGPSKLTSTNRDEDQQALVSNDESSYFGSLPILSLAVAKPMLGSIIPDRSISYRSLAVIPSSFDVTIPEWPLNSPAPYSFLTHALSTLSGTRSRIAILNTLTNTLRVLSRHHPTSLLPALYLLSNSLSPPHSPVELGLGPSIISKAIQHVSGLTPASLRRLYITTGDAGMYYSCLLILACLMVYLSGDVAFEAKSNLRTLVPHPPLLVVDVYDSLLKIAYAKGQGAAKQKQAIVEKLLVAAKGEETRFLVRTLSQNLRVGAVRTSILTALARAMVMTSPSLHSSNSPSSQLQHSAEITSAQRVAETGTKANPADPMGDALNQRFVQAEALIKKVYAQHPNYDHIIQELLNGGLDGLLDRLPLTVGESFFEFDHEDG